MNRSFLTFLCATAISVAGHGQKTAVADALPPISLSGFETQAAYAVDLSTGNTIYDYQGSKRLTPASITKLFSTAAALTKNGPKARIRTKIGLVADSAEVVVHGVFDPTTDSRFFNKNQMAMAVDTLAEILKEKGQTHLRRLSADLSLGFFSPYCSKRLWEDMGNGYGAAPTALTFNDNNVDVYFNSPKEIDAPCVIDSVVPDMGGFRPTNYVRSYKGNSDLCNMYLAGNDLWFATGCIPSSRDAMRVRSAMPEPELHYMRRLRLLLSQRGIETDSIVLYNEQKNVAEETIMSLWSPTMKEIATATNTYSVNLFADALAVNMCTRHSHATWSGTIENLKKYWQERIGFRPNIFDASGLSPSGALSPKELTKLLEYMHKSKVAKEFYETLPVVGKNGTVSSISTPKEMRGRIRAKSGSMNGVIAYAGYIEKNKKRTIAFCIIVNHHGESSNSIKQGMLRWLKEIEERIMPKTEK